MTNKMKQAGAALLTMAMIATLYVCQERPNHHQLVYTASGYGGYEAAPKPAAHPKTTERTIISTTGGEGSAASPKAGAAKMPAGGVDVDAALQPAKEAYNGGDYAQAGKIAREVAQDLSHSRKPTYQQTAVEAQDIEAYSDARQKNYKEARQEFAVLQSEARGADGGPGTGDGGPRNLTAETQRAAESRRGNGDGGQRTEDGAERMRIDPTVLGEPATGDERMQEIEQDAGYQHAVLTAALGNKPAAEREYLSFMKQYPGSPLVFAAVKRVEQMHGGNLPAVDAAVWRETTAEAEKEQKQQELAESMCGPECLAELLRREARTKDGGRRTEEQSGEASAADEEHMAGFSEPTGTEDEGRRTEEVQALAKEMGTSDKGTSMEAMQSAANERGLSLRGVQLSWKGLTEQKLPAIGVELPGHYVLIEQVDPKSVTVWDPDGEGANQPGRRVYSKNQWQQIWERTALVIAR